jgi:hypothetical protein
MYISNEEEEYIRMPYQRVDPWVEDLHGGTNRR